MRIFAAHMLNLLHALSAGCAIFLAFLVVALRQHTNTIANRWLAFFLLMLGLFMLDDSFMVYGIYQQQPWLFGLFALSSFALAPAMYLCVAYFVDLDRQNKKYVWGHLCPALLFLLLSLPFLFSNNAVKLAEINRPPALRPSDMVLLPLLFLQTVFYWSASLRKLLRHRRNIENISASTAGNLDWLLYLLYGIGGMIVIWFADLYSNPLVATASWVTPGYFLIIWWLGYFSLQQREIYPFSRADTEALQQIMVENEQQAVTPRRSTLSEEILRSWKEQLLNKMAADRPYLDSELSLPELARQMQLSVHDLSQLVNEGFGENFAQFINRYRVEESKRLLHSDKHRHFNMVGIAFEAGFNSKTAFNTAFKKATGCSPSEFRRQKQPSAEFNNF